MFATQTGLWLVIGMTTASSPEVTLAGLRSVRRTVVRERIATAWVPLAVFGLVLLGADFFNRHPGELPEIPVGGGFREQKGNWLANVAGAPASIPGAVFWLVVLPVAFGVCAVWLRWQTRRAGVEQHWLRGAVIALVPFAALLVLRLVAEPLSPGLHYQMSYGNRGAWLQPVACFQIGMLAWAVSTRSRFLITAVGGVVVANTGWWCLQAGTGGRDYNTRQRAVQSFARTLGSWGVGMLGLTGMVLLIVAVADFAVARRWARGRT